MKIILKVSMAGPDVSHSPGDQIDVSDDVGAAWVGAEIAEAVADPTPKEQKPAK